MKFLKINKSKKFSEFFDEINFVRKIDFLVLHHVEANSAQHAIDQFIEYKVSSHFLIDEAGEIFELVDENNISYHAGVSFWNGCDGLNKASIGIEFINSAPFKKNFELVQMQAGIELCQYLIEKYNIKISNIIGHSDIAYNKEIGFLDRKQDPSHLFDWKFLAQNGVGIFPENFLQNSLQNSLQREEKLLFKFGDNNSKISEIKKSLAKFGYKISNFNDVFDEEMTCVTRVFNRHFNQDVFENNSDIWCASSQLILDELVKAVIVSYHS